MIFDGYSFVIVQVVQEYERAVIFRLGNVHVEWPSSTNALVLAGKLTGPGAKGNES